MLTILIIVNYSRNFVNIIVRARLLDSVHDLLFVNPTRMQPFRVELHACAGQACSTLKDEVDDVATIFFHRISFSCRDLACCHFCYSLTTSRPIHSSHVWL